LLILRGIPSYLASVLFNMVDQQMTGEDVGGLLASARIAARRFPAQLVVAEPRECIRRIFSTTPDLRREDVPLRSGHPPFSVFAA
jgi:hypothetical protein